jgi:acetoin utilization deacetylase AcuC-like enzyme
VIRIAFDPIYKLPLPQKHRFPMMKYELIPRQLTYEGSYEEPQFFSPEPMCESVVDAVHDATYIQQLKDGTIPRRAARRIGFPYSQQLIEREYCITYGTIQGALFARDSGFAFNIAGGTHHAYRDRGEGYCIYNDIAVSARYLLDHTSVRQILVVDLDVHQGNGTAAIFQDEPRVFTFSMHGARNFPLHKEASDRDLPLADGTGDDEYLQRLQAHLPDLIDRVKPDLIYYQAGVDILASDKLGTLNISRKGCYQRDEQVLETAWKHQIPVMAVMGGGYSDSLREILEAHCNTYRIAKDLYD